LSVPPSRFFFLPQVLASLSFPQPSWVLGFLTALASFSLAFYPVPSPCSTRLFRKTASCLLSAPAFFSSGNKSGSPPPPMVWCFRNVHAFFGPRQSPPFSPFPRFSVRTVVFQLSGLCYKPEIPLGLLRLFSNPRSLDPCSGRSLV